LASAAGASRPEVNCAITGFCERGVGVAVEMVVLRNCSMAYDAREVAWEVGVERISGDLLLEVSGPWFGATMGNTSSARAAIVCVEACSVPDGISVGMGVVGGVIVGLCPVCAMAGKDGGLLAVFGVPVVAESAAPAAPSSLCEAVREGTRRAKLGGSPRD